MSNTLNRALSETGSSAETGAMKQRALARGAGERRLKVTKVPAGTPANRCTDAPLAMLMKSLVPGSWMRVSP